MWCKGDIKLKADQLYPPLSTVIMSFHPLSPDIQSKQQHNKDKRTKKTLLNMLASLLTWCISQKTLSMWEKDCEQIFFKLSDYRIFTMNIINKILKRWFYLHGPTGRTSILTFYPLLLVSYWCNFFISFGTVYEQ